MKVDCVRDVEGFVLGVDDKVAAVMFKGDAKVEAIGAVEVPGAACRWFVVFDDRAAKWQKGGGVVVEGAIEVFPG